MNEEYIIEMLNITKRFPGIVANDNITLQLKNYDLGMLHVVFPDGNFRNSVFVRLFPEAGPYCSVQKYDVLFHVRSLPCGAG